MPIYYKGKQYFIGKCLELGCIVDVVHCEPEPVIDINNTNLVIDFVPMEEDS